MVWAITKDYGESAEGGSRQEQRIGLAAIPMDCLFALTACNQKLALALSATFRFPSCL
jgi:hypothetical protein